MYCTSMLGSPQIDPGLTDPETLALVCSGLAAPSNRTYIYVHVLSLY